ncbi:hypothetical protein DICVIV_02528 [Dictyocaulus viviparus]|uniref:Uncharacterized protein n=1 Tax=Dictyocaulus viviparus TaxID=29172 RepID=A0A0D8Y3P0_DICVI|nr:hypothetical protein DICVIV_02528 [Dictyocaulus viviparus]
MFNAARYSKSKYYIQFTAFCSFEYISETVVIHYLKVTLCFSSDRHIKSRRLEKIVRKLRSTAKRRNSYHSLYREGQSLFILPKTLSKSVRQWKHYEDRFKQWLDNHHIGINRNSQPNSSFPTHGHYTSSSGDVSYVSHNSTYEDDPLRAFYTIWYLNMNKVSKNKLSTTGGIFEYIGSVWESDPVKRSILKSPKGGISGRIENRLSLSAKARVTLQKWSRVTSITLGEDDDPLDMWNHCMENSMIRHDTNVCSPVSATPFRNSSLRQRMHETSMATGSNGTVECLVSTSTSHSSGKLFINSSTMNASNTGNDESSPLDALSPKDSLVVKVSHTRTQVGSVRGDTGIHSNISSGSVRRSQRILANAKQKTTTPETTKTPVNSKKNSATNSSKKSASSSAKNSRYECSSTRLRADNTSILTPHIKKSGTKKRSVAQYSGLSEDINKVNLSSSTPIITSKSKKSKSWY